MAQLYIANSLMHEEGIFANQNQLQAVPERWTAFFLPKKTSAVGGRSIEV
jgi:hypothetical protein